MIKKEQPWLAILEYHSGIPILLLSILEESHFIIVGLDNTTRGHDRVQEYVFKYFW